MATKKTDATAALVTVIDALESLQEEKDRQWVLQSAASKFDVTLQVPSAGGAGTTVGLSGASGTADVRTAIEKKNVRDFIRIKKPVTDVQRVACLGYYLVHTTGQPGFTSKDVSVAHTDSGGSKINLTRALDNATRQSKYISNRLGREKQLTTLGEDVVNALPNQEAVKAVEAEVKKPRGRKPKNAKKA